MLIEVEVQSLPTSSPPAVSVSIGDVSDTIHLCSEEPESDRAPSLGCGQPNFTGELGMPPLNLFPTNNHDASFVTRDSARFSLISHTSLLNIHDDDDEEEDEDESEDYDMYRHNFLWDESLPTNETSYISDQSSPPAPLEQLDLLKMEEHSDPTIGDYHVCPETPQPEAPHWCGPVHTTSSEEMPTKNHHLHHRRDSSLFDQMTEQIVDSLCFQDHHQHQQLSPSQRKNAVEGIPNHDVASWHTYQKLIHYDILELLNCTNNPDHEEIKKVWSWSNQGSSIFCDRPCTDSTIPTPPRSQGPRRFSLQERAYRVHRLRQERAMPPRITGLSPSPSPVSVLCLSKSKSMDERLMAPKFRPRCSSPNLASAASLHNNWLRMERDLEQRLGWLEVMDPAVSPSPNSTTMSTNSTAKQDREDVDTTGYDSDPGEFSFVSIESMVSRNNNTDDSLVEPYQHETGPQDLAFRSVITSRDSQSRTMIGTDLKDEDESDNEALVFEEEIPQVVHESLNLTWTLTWHPGRSTTSVNPVCVQAWIERGTFIHLNTVMLEPCLMWRTIYQPSLATKRKLNATTQKPYSIRLLNLCRIRETLPDLDRSVYPLVRTSHSFLMRTSQAEEFIFEAASTSERDDVIRRWKLCVARFATLAVLEDIRGITSEFFMPSPTNLMLIPT